ncbi:MAG: YidC/Oxa1 family membrane protein insertase [Chloroflexi bacterium]|nr:YidC/Oxa1 family membrane protein insertase [Chloroflexota bacterium]MYD47077.1 YidC/Oxa1 family membrane protein insertase [Chloroflexota bacterium]
MEFFSIFVLLWNEVIIRPMLNTLLVLYVLCLSQMGLAIIAFTVLVRVVTIPLTVRQLRQMRSMTGLQPKVREIQERYAGDRQRISQETMALYRQSGVNPIGCLGPLIVQMPILIGLFRVLILTLFNNPEDLVNLSDKLYSWVTFVPIHAAIPVNNGFLWMDLSRPDPSPIVMPVLVAVTTWVQQKMTQMPSPDPRQQSSQTMMLWMMPIFLGAFSLGWPSGLPLYWVVSNLIGIGIQYFITGWGPLFPLFPRRGEQQEESSVTLEEVVPTQQESSSDGPDSTNRENRRRGRRAGARNARRRPQRGRGRNTK